MMSRELETEMLHFLDRPSLDGVQLVSKRLQVAVQRNGKSLPLRYVRMVVCSLWFSSCAMCTVYISQQNVVRSVLEAPGYQSSI